MLSSPSRKRALWITIWMLESLSLRRVVVPTGSLAAIWSETRQTRKGAAVASDSMSRISRSGHHQRVAAERCPSGLRSTPGKCVWVHSPSRVRIPPSPPVTVRNFLFCNDLFHVNLSSPSFGPTTSSAWDVRQPRIAPTASPRVYRGSAPLVPQTFRNRARTPASSRTRRPAPPLPIRRRRRTGNCPRSTELGKVVGIRASLILPFSFHGSPAPDP